MFTLAQIASFQDGAILPGPCGGTVKQAFDVKTHPEYGQSQGFVLADSTGEVACFLGADDKVPFAPVKRGDQLEIFPAPNSKGQLSGVKKGTYNNRPQLKIYDNRFVRNLSSPAATQPASYGHPAQQQAAAPFVHPGYTSPATWQAGGTTPQAQAVPNPAPTADRPSSGVATARNAKMTEEEARDCFVTNFSHLCRAIGYAPGELPAHLAPVLGAWCSGILIGRQKGDILPDPEPQRQADYGAGDRHARQQAGRVDPPWMSEDGAPAPWEGEP